MQLWDVLTRRRVASLGGRTGAFCVVFSPDAKLLAAACGDKTVRLWDIAARREVASFPENTYFRNLAFSPDGKILATSGIGKTVKLWDTGAWRAAGMPKRWRWAPNILRGHAGITIGLAFSPDGKTLASGSTDSTVKLWNVATKQEVATLKGHKGPIWALAFSPDGRTIASGSIDTTIRLWRAASFAETDAPSGAGPRGMRR